MNFRFAASAAFLSTLLLITSSCGKNSSFRDQVSRDTGSRLVAETASGPVLTVHDSYGNPMAGAKILVGQRQNVPYANNYVTTDASGQAIAPADWTTAQPVTIEAAGHVRVTYFGQKPEAATFKLRKTITQQRHEIKGETVGFGNLPNDGIMDVGVVFNAIPRSQASTMQITNLISPETDTMTVFGQTFEIPSNLTVPTQTETYIFPIQFSKPVFRHYVPHGGDWKIVAARARFPLKEVVDGMRGGKKIWDMINKLEFVGASVKPMNIKGNVQTNMTVQDIKFQPAYQVTAPNFASSSVMLAISMVETGGLYYPSDVKRLMPREKLTLSAPRGSSGFIVNLLTKANQPYEQAALGVDAEDVTAVLTTTNKANGVEFLDNVKAPAVRSSTLVVNPPQNKIRGVVPAMTYSVLSKVEVIQAGKMKLERKYPQWELYANEWVQSFDLPEMPGAQKAGSGHRWETVFGGATGAVAKKLVLGPETLENLSHVTKSAVDL